MSPVSPLSPVVPDRTTRASRVAAQPTLANSHVIRNPIGWRDRLARFRGSSVELDLRSYDQPLAEIAAMEAEVAALSEDDLDAGARGLRDQVRAGASRDSVRTRFFAIVREISRRAVGLRPFDVQIVAGLALDRGAVVEMQTGEGKTLAAVMPAR